MLDQLIALKNKLKNSPEYLNIAIDANVRAAVNEYKENNIFMRWIYRAFTDEEILDKTRAVAYDDMVRTIETIENTLPTKIQSSKKLCYVDPDDSASMFPQYSMQELIKTPKNLESNRDTYVYKPIENAKQSLSSKLNEVHELSDVNFYKGNGNDGFLQQLKSDITTSFDNLTSGIGKIFDGLINRARLTSSRRMLNPSQIVEQTKAREKLSLKEDSAEKIFAASRKSDEIESLLNKLTPNEASQFENKYPHYIDQVTLSVITDPVIWKGDNKSYQRESIKVHINNQLGSGNTKVRDFNNTEYSVTVENNLSLVANTDLQDKILSDLTSFYQEKHPEVSLNLENNTNNLRAAMSI